MIWISHPTGNTFVRALLEELVPRGAPFHFFTTLGQTGNSGRRCYNIPRETLSTRPVLEAARLALERVAAGRSRQMLNRFADFVFADLDRAVARRISTSGKAPHTLYAYEDCALETFTAARRKGLRCIYDLPIAYWETSRRILLEEAERLPEWEATLGATSDSVEKLERKTRELELADAVVCPSKSVLNSLPGEIRRTRPCVVSHFGSPTNPPPRRSPGKRLRLLFAGSMSQRKGLADVFAAVRLLSTRQIELVVIGSRAAPEAFYRRQFPDFLYEPPRPHREVLELMASCDLLVLPSLVEGRALVQQEALACGLPLIVTPNAGGEDLIVEGETGFLVPIRAPEEIAKRIEYFAAHRTDLEEMRRFCQAKAAEYSWDCYAGRILDCAAGIQANEWPHRYRADQTSGPLPAKN